MYVIAHSSAESSALSKSGFPQLLSIRCLSHSQLRRKRSNRSRSFCVNVERIAEVYSLPSVPVPSRLKFAPVTHLPPPISA
jgi:hypothetical protein